MSVALCKRKICMDLNKEVIKIFIEGWLVRHHGFILKNNQVEKNEKVRTLIFHLIEDKLELYDISNKQVIISIELPKLIASKDCISLAVRYCIDIVEIM